MKNIILLFICLISNASIDTQLKIGDPLPNIYLPSNLKNEVSLVEASANPINQEVLKTSAEETFSSGFGSGNLASILASQSSSNETVNRR